MEPGKNYSFCWKVATVLLLSITAPVIHIFYVFIVWDDGVTSLSATLDAERNLLFQLVGARVGSNFDSALDWVHELVFVSSGIQSEAYGNEKSFFRGALYNNWELVQTLIVSGQLIGLRLTALFMSLPLFVSVLLAGFSTGYCARYLRRTGCERESSYIYHNARRTLSLTVFTLILGYLIPVCVMDPRFIVLPALLIIALSLHSAVAYFKKYL